MADLHDVSMLVIERTLAYDRLSPAATADDP
jgi:hypothetical protein